MEKRKERGVLSASDVKKASSNLFRGAVGGFCQKRGSVCTRGPGKRHREPTTGLLRKGSKERVPGQGTSEKIWGLEARVSLSATLS